MYATIFRQNPLGLPATISGTPVNLDTEKQETGKIATLVKLNSKDAEILQREAWSTFQQLASNGGYPDIPLPEPPAVRPLRCGVPLSEQDLYGTWAGTISLYPVGPADMLLHVERTPDLKARLEIKYHSKDFPDESILLSDFRIDGSRLLFSDPKSPGVDNLEVRLTGVMPARGELQGTAEASKENVKVLGHWSLKKLP